MEIHFITVRRTYKTVVCETGIAGTVENHALAKLTKKKKKKNWYSLLIKCMKILGWQLSDCRFCR